MVDYEDFNSTIIPFVEEAGNLGEQNWSATSGLVRDEDLDPGVGLAFAHTYTESDASDSVQNPTGNEAIVQPISSWVEVEGMSAEFTSSGEALYVLASLQYSTAYPATLGTQLVWTKFGIALDGAVLPELVVGDQDTGPEGPAMEIGVTGYGRGVDIDGVIKLEPGYHRVTVMAWVDNIEDLTTEIYIQVCNRELLVLEMW